MIEPTFRFRGDTQSNGTEMTVSGSFSVSGEYQGSGLFITRVETYPWIVVIGDLSISTLFNQAPELISCISLFESVSICINKDAFNVFTGSLNVSVNHISGSAPS